MEVKVRLLGKDNALHGEGLVNTDKLAEAHVVERNGHVYAFQKMEGFGLAIFRECGPAVLLTEF
jgi:hypothetical protein